MSQREVEARKADEREVADLEGRQLLERIYVKLCALERAHSPTPLKVDHTPTAAAECQEMPPS